MKVLFIGGTGLISSASSELAIKNGIDLFHLNRGHSSSLRPVQGAKLMVADIRNAAQVQESISNQEFDVVVDWISFLPEHLDGNMDVFKGKTKQYVFISSASAYQTPPKALPVTEETPLHNPFWQYSRDKIACETLLMDKAPKLDLQYTIVRPSHTYDKFTIPMFGKYNVLNRMIQGKEVPVPGDGASLWTLTHHTDFAKGMVGLLGNEKAYNEDFHITSEEWISWEQIYHCFADALGVKARLVGVPTHVLAKFNKDMGDSLLGDKSHSMIFDNSKLRAAVPEFKCTVPFAQGAKEIVDWHQSNPAEQVVNKELDVFMDEVIKEIKNI
jgi:nucleoside-diphosphate-sugar epimerase